MNLNCPFRLCLLIDDSDLDNFINFELIKTNNFASEVVVFDNPQVALTQLQKGSVEPDIIFLDIKMPQMTGFEFLTEFDKLAIDKSHIKVYMLSSSVNPNDIRLADEDRYVSGYLIKNLTRDMLVNIIG